ncbi:MAG: hypothetical protein E7173_01375 [Firmicutes bacterium]|nr:hypothetical protein [Bacillota bacterium]
MDNNSNVNDLGVQIESYLESKEWYDLTLKEMELITDRSKKVQYKRKFNEYFSSVINPLYDGIKNKGQFKFSHADDALTCRNMVQDLLKYYYDNGFTRDEAIRLATSKKM